MTTELPKETRHIKYTFTAVEIHDLSLNMAWKTKEQEEVTDEKKSVVSQYAARLNEIKATLNKLSNQISDGYEMREGEFTIEYHKPGQGQKTLIQIDGSEVIVEKMNPMDHNLFNQYSDVSKDEAKGLKDSINIEREKLPFDINDIIDSAKPEKSKGKLKIVKDDGLSDPIKEARKALRGKGPRKVSCLVIIHYIHFSKKLRSGELLNFIQTALRATLRKRALLSWVGEVA